MWEIIKKRSIKMNFYISKNYINDCLKAEKAIQETFITDNGDIITLETALQMVSTFMLCNEISNLRATINNLNLILRHEDY